MRRIASALLRDKGLAEDVVQQAFVIAIEKPPPRADGLGAWLRRVVRHRAIDLRRASERRRRRELAVARPEAAPCQTTAAEGLALQHKVVDAVAALPEPYRTVIYLRYYEGLAPRAIAARDSIPVKTIKSQLWRGLEMLRTRLDAQHPTRSAWAGLLLPIAQGSFLQPLPGEILTIPAAGAIVMKANTVVAFCVALALLGTTVLVVDWSGQRAPDSSELDSPQSTVVRKPPQAPVRPIETARREVATEPSADQDAVAESTGELHVRCVWSDGTPASGVRVVIEPNRQRFLGLGKQRFVSDTEGTVLVAQLTPGLFKVLSDRGQSVEAKVTAGERAEVQLKMRPGVDVRGRVVDANNFAVPGAQVWLAGDVLDWSSGFPTTRCGADGRFLLRSIRPGDSLWASAANHGPSALVDLESQDVASGEVEIELTLSDVGASLYGRVIDSEGEAVEGARVALGVIPTNHLETRVDGTRIEVAAPRIALSDESGRFSFHGVAPGPQSIVAHAEGWPVWRREVAVESVGTPSLLIQLERGAFVSGVIYDGSGEPLEGAIVLALPVPFHDRFPGQGYSDKGTPFPHPGARADGRGAFELPPLAAGQVHLYASKGERIWSERGEKDVDYQGSAQETLTVYAGQEVVWSPQISLGATIEGRVSYSDGAPMRACVRQRKRRTQRTDQDHHHRQRRSVSHKRTC